MGSRIESLWYGTSPLGLALAPLGWLYCAGAWLRRVLYRLGVFRIGHVGAPVIVVGNISVGGTGKTPLVIWIAHFLKSRGLRPGIVSRGYRGRADKWPQQVRPDSDPVSVGDEPVLLAQATRCPVAADPDRLRAARTLLAHADCDVIVSDDGLQHLQEHDEPGELGELLEVVQEPVRLELGFVGVLGGRQQRVPTRRQGLHCGLRRAGR